MQFSDNKGPDQPAHRCPPTESVDTVVYVDDQKKPRLFCTDVHADLGLRYQQNV